LRPEERREAALSQQVELVGRVHGKFREVVPGTAH
jgi:hypothetical protein